MTGTTELKITYVTDASQVKPGDEVAVIRRGWLNEPDFFVRTVSKVSARITLDDGTQYHKSKYSQAFRGYGDAEGSLALIDDAMRTKAEETRLRKEKEDRAGRRRASAARHYGECEDASRANRRASNPEHAEHAAISLRLLKLPGLSVDQLQRINAILNETAGETEL